ncbi:MAG: OmpA family protein, partial [Ferruginibacter sp.]
KPAVIGVALLCSSKKIKFYFLFAFVLFISQNASAQNLFANEGFEDLNVCNEYHIDCAPEAWFYINPTTNPLVNGRLVPRPMLGHNLLLIPVYNVFTPAKTKSFVYTMLACPLVKGEKYKLTFFINTSKRKFYNLDFCFSDMEPANEKFNTENVTPTFSITPAQIVAEMKQGWQAVEYEFMATANAQFCMLGNTNATLPYTVQDIMNKQGAVYYFLDDLKLMAIGGTDPCKNYDKRIKMMYDQNYRHTELRLVDEEGAKPPKPVFTKDTFSIPSVFFENNSAVIKTAFIKKLDSLSANLENKKIAKIQITGHTDNNGTIEKNLVLSLARAEAMKTYFINKFPTLADIIFTDGQGQKQPIVTNITAAGRTKNRRVEIVLTIQE